MGITVMLHRLYSTNPQFSKKTFNTEFHFQPVTIQTLYISETFFFFMNHVDPDNYIYVKHAENSLFIQLGKK